MLAQQEAATAWKQSTPLLPEAARAAAPWINHQGQPRGRYTYCLPPDHAEFNLLPQVRDEAMSLFVELGIDWHCGVGEGPGNHLLSSQVQCVNALLPMVSTPELIVAAFGRLVDIDEVLEIEPGRFLTFEYIGPHDYFNEGNGKPRQRGSRCTSVDAAFRYRTRAGDIELALVEWKYTESYLTPRRPEPAKDRIRAARYLTDFHATNGPIRDDVLDFESLLDEPFYQLLRQQLLAHRLERDQVLDARTVRVIHVLSPFNTGYQDSLPRPAHRELGSSVSHVWSQLLRQPDRFLHLDLEAFLDHDVTGADYADRYTSEPVLDR